MADFSDDFNRADNPATLGEGWSSPLNVWGIVGNRARAMTSASDDGPAPVLRDVGSADVSVRVVVAEPLNHFGLALRSNAGGDTYLFVYSTGVIRLFERSGADYGQVGEEAVAVVGAGDELRADAEGDQITVYVNDVLTLGPLTTNLQQNSTRHGISSVGMGATFESFSIDDLNDVPPPPPPPPPVLDVVFDEAFVNLIRPDGVPTTHGAPKVRDFPFVVVNSSDALPVTFTTEPDMEEEVLVQTTVAALDPVEAETIGAGCRKRSYPTHDGGGPPLVWDLGEPGREVGRWPGGTRKWEQAGAGPGGARVYYWAFDTTVLVQRSMAAPDPA